MEQYLHEKYKEFKINGEWFNFTDEKVKTIVQQDVPVSSLVFAKEKSQNHLPVSFSNVERDSPEGTYVQVKVREFFNKEERERRKQEGIAARVAKKLAKQSLVVNVGAQDGGDNT